MATITFQAFPPQSTSRACACQALRAVHCICCTFQPRLLVLEHKGPLLLGPTDRATNMSEGFLQSYTNRPPKTEALQA